MTELESLEKNVVETKAVADDAEAAYDIYEEASAVADEAYAVASHALLDLMNVYKQIDNMREKHSNELTNTISGL